MTAFDRGMTIGQRGEKFSLLSDCEQREEWPSFIEGLLHGRIAREAIAKGAKPNAVRHYVRERLDALNADSCEIVNVPSAMCSAVTIRVQ